MNVNENIFSYHVNFYICNISATIKDSYVLLATVNYTAILQDHAVSYYKLKTIFSEICYINFFKRQFCVVLGSFQMNFW